jgi:CRP/FNR family transcriptional regulator
MNIKAQFGQIFEPELLAEIEAKAKFIKKHEDEVLLDTGEIIRTIPLVVSGSLKIIRVSDKEKELLLYYIGVGGTCVMTLTCCMERHPSEIRAIAEDEVELFAVPVDLADIWITKYSTWKSFIMRSIRSRFLEMINTVDEIAFQKLDERLIAYLGKKSRITGSNLLDISHQQIADEMATSRVVISRLLKALEDDKKVLLFRNQIRLITVL